MIFSRLLFLFIFIPIAELFLLLQIGARVGLMPTLGLIVFTGILGASLARHQGLAILQKIKSEMQQGRPPAVEMVEGAMVVIGGVVLLTPGVLTDCFGFALMVPKFRRSIASKIQKGFSKNFQGGQSFHTNSNNFKSSNFKNKDDDVIDI